MLTSSLKTLRRAWIALAVITLLSFAVAEKFSGPAALETAVVVAAGAVKGRIILVQFMGARMFPAAWRIFFATWLLVNTAVIIGFFTLS